MSDQRSQQADKIDIVYLWVDGSDPVWRGKHEAAYAAWQGQHPDALAAHGNSAGRYRDNGELRFNLRSLDKFFHDHGHVYIVTDGQSPHWLQPSEHVTLIDHASLIPASRLPVYDSGHIESYLHHIPGLSEKFFYLNDDVFFGAPVNPDWWFGERLKVFFEAAQLPAFTELQPHATALVNASIYAGQWLRQQDAQYRHDARVLTHAPRPMLKSAARQLEQLAPELFARVRTTRFRAWHTPAIVPDLLPRWMVHAGYAEALTLDPLHISSGDANAPQQLAALKKAFGTLPFFCINDTCDDATDDDLRLMRVTQTLEALLPEASSFERPHRRQPTRSAKIA